MANHIYVSMYQKHWHFPDPVMGKIKAFQKLGDRFKSFKSKLNVKYVQTGKEPFDDYNISIDDWEQFKALKQDEHHKVLFNNSFILAGNSC